MKGFQIYQTPLEGTKILFSSFPSFQRFIFREEQQLMELKKNCNLCPQLYVSYQVHRGDWIHFFHMKILSVSQFGKVFSSSKSDLLKCFHQHSNVYEKEPNVDAIAVNATAIISMLKSGQFKTFKDCTTGIFLPCVQSRLRKVQHIDVPWDNYFNDSLKAKHEKNMKKEYGEESKSA